MIDLIREVAQVATLDIPVLIQGETGTGKELLAKAVHDLSGRRRGPLVAFNCATCPADLLDSELFGYVRGAFTGANADRKGLVRTAEGGTLFLDEIGEMRDESQARLLRLLDSGEVRPLGSDRTGRVDLRIVAATHVDLEDRIRLKQFRRDLYFRLAGIRLVIPPLRDRAEDIRDLIEHFCAEIRQKASTSFAGLSPRVVRAMEQYSWPGNIRQLRSEIYRCAALAEPGVPVRTWSPPDRMESQDSLLPQRESEAILSDPDRFAQLFREFEGDVRSFARLLGISRGHVYRLVKRHGFTIDMLRKKLDKR